MSAILDFTQVFPKYYRRKKDNVLIDSKTKQVVKNKLLYKILHQLKIPIVYRTIWISIQPTNGLRAIALDTQNRKQYFYDNQWILKKTDEKYKRLYEMVFRIPYLIQQIQRDKKCVLPNRFTPSRVIAFMIQIMEITNLRIGNKKYHDKYGSHGLATLMMHHVHLKRPQQIIFQFTGKHKVEHHIQFKNAEIYLFLQELIKQNNNTEGWLFCYESTSAAYMGQFFRISAQMVNNYIHAAMGGQKIFSCKDIRTYNANAIFLTNLKKLNYPSPDEKKEIEKNISDAIKLTSQALGHTHFVCKQSYLMQAILNLYRQNPIQVNRLNLLNILKKYSR